MARVPCDLADILTAAVAALVNGGVVTAPQGFIALDPDDLPGVAATQPVAAVSFTEFGQRPDTIEAESGGGDAPVMEGELTVTLWAQTALDQPGQDTAALTDATLGLIALARKVKTTLNNQDLTNARGTLTWRSLTFLGVRNRGRLPRDRNWRRLDVRFNAAFEWQAF